MSYVDERFKLDEEYKDSLRQRDVAWGFGAFSEVIYYRTYSRLIEGKQEQWADTVIRVAEGVMSIRKDWYTKMHIKWDAEYWEEFAEKLTDYIFDMKFLPPGRGLWAMGTDYIYERGSASLFNCGFVDVKDDLADAAKWAMDMLMLGVGVGASTQNASFERPNVPHTTVPYIVEDSREGWVEATRLLIQGWMEYTNYEFDYSKVRLEGTPLKGFGGVASGPAPLIKLHDRIRKFMYEQAIGTFDRTRLTADILNAIGACVVSGNIRRSAELLTGSIEDSTFLNLKNSDAYPERNGADGWSWMSNNSIVLNESSEFEHIPEIAKGIRDNGEPGLINMINVQKYARVGKRKDDKAVGFNPCAEIPLEDRELCNLAEVFPTRCSTVEELWDALEVATFYASTVSLLPTHEPTTNAVIMRNRRIGVSGSGIADWLDSTNLSHITMALRKGYEEHVEPTNIRLAKEAGVPPSIRLTTVKPSGTISLLAGVSPGMHFPTSRYAIRRVRISETSPIVQILKNAGLEWEKDAYSDNTLCFSFPLAAGGGITRAVSEVSIWEQVSLVAMLQREWADNSVSNTLTFREDEEPQIERVLAAFAPLVKSISMLPDQDERAAKGGRVYMQPPYESISYEEYKVMQDRMPSIDWTGFTGSDGMDSKYCTNEECELPMYEGEV